MRTILAIPLLLSLAACTATPGNGTEARHGTSIQSATPCATCASHGLTAAEGLNWMKGMSTGSGQWTCTVPPPADGKPQTLYVHYKTISSGSTVCETLFPGTDHEMVTLYHLDGDRLMATHYCAMGNQPRMIATLCACDPNAKTAAFKFLDGTNLDAAKQDFMGNQDYTFVNADTVRINWRHLGPGGSIKGEMPSTFTRVK